MSKRCVEGMEEGGVGGGTYHQAHHRNLLTQNWTAGESTGSTRRIMHVAMPQ